MSVLEVAVLSYDDYINMYVVEYRLLIRSGVARRTKAFYRNGELSRDSDNKVLLQRVKEAVKVYNRKNNIDT